MNTSVERLLRYLRFSGPAVAADLDGLSDRRWHAIVDCAIEQEVEGLLYRRLSEAGARSSVPPAVLQRLEDLYICGVMWNTKVLADAGTALEALQRNGIEVVVLKGAHLAESVYRDIGLRPMTDVDLLVKPDNLARAEAVLVKLGHGDQAERPDVALSQAERHHLQPFRQPNSTTIEVHWNIERPSSPFRIDIEGLWARARPCVVAGVDALALGPEDLLLHLCTHASYHHRFGMDHHRGIALKHLYDIALVASDLRDEIDWIELVNTANADGRAPFIYATCGVVGSMFGAEFPHEIHALAHGPAEDRAARDVRACLLNPKPPVGCVRMRGSAGWYGKSLALLRAIFPPLADLREMYDVPADSWLQYGYYVVRPVELLIRRGSVIAGMAGLTSGLRREFEVAERVQVWLDTPP